MNEIKEILENIIKSNMQGVVVSKGSIHTLKMCDEIESYINSHYIAKEKVKNMANPEHWELLPIVDKTREWFKFHNDEMRAEVVFNNLTDDDGVVRQRPVKAIYYSPLFKFQEVIKEQPKPTPTQQSLDKGDS